MLKTMTIAGRIIVVQEMRFRIVTDDGRGYLFTLARNANVDTTELRRLHARDTPVRVTYAGQPGLDSCVAKRVVTEWARGPGNS
jgi:hypothetical protein